MAQLPLILMVHRHLPVGTLMAQLPLTLMALLPLTLTQIGRLNSNLILK